MVKAYVLWIISIAILYLIESNVYQLIHFAILALSMELIPLYIPDAFSVSELFIFAAINAFFTSFCWDSVIYIEQRKYISGCNVSNIIIFTPWVFINLTGLVHIVTKKASLLLSALIGLSMTLLSIWPVLSP